MGLPQPTCPGCRERDARIASLEALVAKQQAQIQELTEKVQDLTKKLHDLTHPPTPRPRDPMPPGPSKKPTGKKRGGQPGHPPHLKELAPPERVKETITYIPTTCEHCQAPLPKKAAADDPAPTRHQIAELPEVAAEITEHQGHARTCSCCGKVTRASIPAEVRAHSVGARLLSVLMYLVGSHGLSKRGAEETAEAVFGVSLSLGTIANLEQELSDALEPAYQQAVAAVQEAPVKHLDETGWKQAGAKRWLWVAATNQVVAFLIHRLRNLTAMTALLGATMRGILCSDRWKTYDHWPVLQRQVCWAHLRRNWEKMVERGGKAQVIGEASLDVQRRVFELWHLFRGGGCTRAQLDERMVPLSLELLEVLRQGARCRDARTKRFCERLWKVYPALWTFVEQEGVEPTNNHAERVQRRAVLWRRRSFGCQSTNGCRFVERILTVVQTLRLQNRSVVEFLREAIVAARSRRASPRLA